MQTHNPPRRAVINGAHSPTHSKNIVNGHGARPSADASTDGKTKLSSLLDRVQEETEEQLAYNEELQQCARENTLYLLGQHTTLLAGMSDLCEFFGVKLPDYMPALASITLLPGGREVQRLRTRGASVALAHICTIHQQNKDTIAAQAREIVELKAQVAALKAEQVSISSLPAGAVLAHAERVTRKYSDHIATAAKTPAKITVEDNKDDVVESAVKSKPAAPKARMVTAGQVPKVGNTAARLGRPLRHNPLRFSKVKE